RAGAPQGLLRADDAHPPRRGGDCRAVPGAGDPLPDAPVDRPGGGGRRRLPGALGAGRHVERPPVPRPLPREGRQPAPAVRRALRQGDRVLRRQGRLDASGLTRDRNARRLRDRGRHGADRRRRGPAGDGPACIEAKTYRWREHVGPNFDVELGYRTQAELDAWMARDPLLRHARILETSGVLTAAERLALDREVEAEVADAVRFA